MLNKSTLLSFRCNSSNHFRIEGILFSSGIIVTIIIITIFIVLEIHACWVRTGVTRAAATRLNNFSIIIIINNSVVVICVCWVRGWMRLQQPLQELPNSSIFSKVHGQVEEHLPAVHPSLGFLNLL